MKYLSIDIETTGLNPRTHDIVEIGAVIDDLNEPQSLDKLPRFHTYVLPTSGAGYHGDPYALSMHQHIFERIAKRELGYTYLAANQVAEHLKAWLLDEGLNVTDGKITVAGKNAAGFDLPFLSHNIWGWDRLPIRHRVLDPGPLYLVPGIDDAVPDLATCLHRAGHDPDLVTHNAIDDALAVVRVIRNWYLGHDDPTPKRFEERSA